MTRPGKATTRSSVLGFAIYTAMTLAGWITPAMGCGDEQARDSSIPTSSDRSWVRSDHVVYAAVSGKGVFRVHLNSNAPDPLALHSERTVIHFNVSPSGRYLIYELANASMAATAYFYDLKDGVEHRIDGFAPYSRMTSSPNDRWLAAEPRPGAPLIIRLLDLHTLRIKQIPVPSDGGEGLTFAFQWSLENQMLLGVRDNNGKESFLRVSPETGRSSPVEASRVNPYTIVYSKNGVRIQTACEQCSVAHAISSAPVVDGGIIVATSERLVLREKNGGERVIAELPPPFHPAPGQPVLICGTRGIRLAGVFDSRYVLFSVGRSMELYGIRENRMAPLLNEPGAIIGW